MLGRTAEPPTTAGGPHPRRTLWAFMLSCPWGPPALPAQPGGHHIPRPRLTHADPAPHLASIWGWYSRGGRGKVTSGREIGGPQGASDPQGRVSEPLKHMTRAAGWSASCPPELQAALWGVGGLALQSLWAAAPASARILPTAQLPEHPALWGSAPDAPLPPALTPKPQVTALQTPPLSPTGTRPVLRTQRDCSWSE